MIGKLFENKKLRYLGKISYDLYLYHKVVPLSLALLLNKLDPHIDNAIIYYLINISILIAVSHISWILIERPTLRLKPRLKYS